VDSQFATLEPPLGEPGVLRLDASAALPLLQSEATAMAAGPGGRMNIADHPAPPQGRLRHAIETAMAICLGVMAVAVFINVVLRYGFGSGIAASEELSRLLFVWMVFIGATAAYPAGEHMAFTSLVGMARGRPRLFAALAC
jgi:hypothetical protein